MASMKFKIINKDIVIDNYTGAELVIYKNSPIGYIDGKIIIGIISCIYMNKYEYEIFIIDKNFTKFQFIGITFDNYAHCISDSNRLFINFCKRYFNISDHLRRYDYFYET